MTGRQKERAREREHWRVMCGPVQGSAEGDGERGQRERGEGKERAHTNAPWAT